MGRRLKWGTKDTVETNAVETSCRRATCATHAPGDGLLAQTERRSEHALRELREQPRGLGVAQRRDGKGDDGAVLGVIVGGGPAGGLQELDDEPLPPMEAPAEILRRMRSTLGNAVEPQENEFTLGAALALPHVARPCALTARAERR